MLIVWGTKRKKKKLGVVADFCPICHEVRKFQLFRIGLASHIYYISFGEGKLAGWEMECSECGSRFSSNPERYQEIQTQESPMQDVTELMRATYPRLPEVMAERFELEDRVRRAPTALTPDERMRLIREPFALVNPEVEARFARGTERTGRQGSGAWAPWFWRWSR